MIWTLFLLVEIKIFALLLDLHLIWDSNSHFSEIQALYLEKYAQFIIINTLLTQFYHLTCNWLLELNWAQLILLNSKWMSFNDYYSFEFYTFFLWLKQRCCHSCFKDIESPYWLKKCCLVFLRSYWKMNGQLLTASSYCKTFSCLWTQGQNLWFFTAKAPMSLKISEMLLFHLCTFICFHKCFLILKLSLYG